MRIQTVYGTLTILLVNAAFSNAIDVPIGGYAPKVGFGLTDEFKAFDIDTAATYNFADKSLAPSPGATWLGRNNQPHFDIALLDTGASLHLLTREARQGFDVVGNGFDGENMLDLGGATGAFQTFVDDPFGIYAAGLAARTNSATFAMNQSLLRGQTSVSVASAAAPTRLPNVLGLPLISQYATYILPSQPQIFRKDGETIRTPNVVFADLGSGGGGINRRASLELRPGASFIAGPGYFSLPIPDPDDPFNLDFHEDPLFPTQMGFGPAGLFADVDIAHEGRFLNGLQLLLDTGATVTTVSRARAVQLGYDPVLDEPDFFTTVIGSGGISEDVPGFIADELNLDAEGGNVTLRNVPLLLLDIVDPGDPGNVVDGILGTNIFNDRNIVIDPIPSVGAGGTGPSLYISDPVTQTRSWSSAAAVADFHQASNWDSPGTPGPLWVAELNNRTNTDQIAVISLDANVFRVFVSGRDGAGMTLRVQHDAELLLFGSVDVQEGGEVVVEHGGVLDARLVNLAGGRLSGDGTVQIDEFENRGILAPGAPIGTLTIDPFGATGVFANRDGGVLAMELGGNTPGTEHDQLVVEGLAVLGGTLEVSLVDLGGGTFVPRVGDTFTLLRSTDEVLGRFDELVLPGVAEWNLAYGSQDVTLSVLSVETLAGDFNGDGIVDGRDFLRWQAGAGLTSGASLTQGDADGDGDVDADDYALWHGNLGRRAAAGGTASISVVPEPTSWLLLAACLLLLPRCRPGH